MTLHAYVAYTPPWIGDVGLLSARWRDEASGQLLHVGVPVLAGKPLWVWSVEAPAEVRELLRQVHALSEAEK